VYVIYSANGHVENDGLLKVTGSNYRSGNISKTVQDGDIVTADH